MPRKCKQLNERIKGKVDESVDTGNQQLQIDEICK